MLNTLDNNLPNNFAVEVIVDAHLKGFCDSDRVTRIKEAVWLAAEHRGFTIGEMGVRVTSDAVIREINSRHLQHDYDTDVISFGYDAVPPRIEGEIVVSIDTARRIAMEVGWPDEFELLLYVVHGTLHITGMDDLDDESRKEMRQSESAVMQRLGIHDVIRFGADIVLLEEPEKSS